MSPASGGHHSNFVSRNFHHTGSPGGVHHTGGQSFASGKNPGTFGRPVYQHLSGGYARGGGQNLAGGFGGHHGHGGNYGYYGRYNGSNWGRYGNYYGGYRRYGYGYPYGYGFYSPWISYYPFGWGFGVGLGSSWLYGGGWPYYGYGGWGGYGYGGYGGYGYGTAIRPPARIYMPMPACRR